MDTIVRDKFIDLWQKFFNGAELPVAFYYTDNKEDAQLPRITSGHRCVISDISMVRKGKPLCFDVNSIGCGGGRRYLGFAEEIAPNFEYFLSYGLPGELEGERYKKTPDLVKETISRAPLFRAPGKYIVFKRWDGLSASDEPKVVIFFARPDELSGLFTLANYDEPELNAVFSPFGAGCATIVQYPYFEKDSERPKAVLGMFDVSARPCVHQDVLTFAVPMKKFIRMINNMEESFLITNSWHQVLKRISSKKPSGDEELRKDFF